MRIRSFFITFQLLLVAGYLAAQQEYVIYEGTQINYRIDSHSECTYTWEILTGNDSYTKAEPTDYLFLTDSVLSDVSILWNIQGDYIVQVTETDGFGCSNKKAVPVKVISNNNSEPFEVDVGPDTIIGTCQPYIFQEPVANEEVSSYLWEPSGYLDDPNSQIPVFIPGETTVFTLTVTSISGATATDTICITVEGINANAGEDIYMYENASAILNGEESTGTGLQYNWTTSNRRIIIGASSANPIIDQFGTYYLEVTDRFGCTDIDTVTVNMLTHAPVAQEDYDTASYHSSIKISVLDNDYDPDNDLDSLSLVLTSLPQNGTASIDYNDFTIRYETDEGFSGMEYFEYRICDLKNNCDVATVCVMVSEYEFFIPTAFSPNGDNINDYFEIIGIERYPNNGIEIFNSQGNRVYQVNNYGIKSWPHLWDGKSNTGNLNGNSDLPTGTYFYILYLGNGQDKIAGSVYLDR